MSEHFCTRGGTEHAFEPRYDEKRHLPNMTFDKNAVVFADNIMQTDRIYRGDVCVRCGAVVNQPAPKGAGT